MSQLHRIALMFDLDGASKQVREIALGVQRFAKAHGRLEVVFDSVATKHLDGRYQGILGPASVRNYGLAKERGVAYAGATFADPGKQHLVVCESPWLIGVLAARHLLARGYRRFAFLGLTGSSFSAAAETSFRAAVRRRGFGLNAVVISSCYHRLPRNLPKFFTHFERWLDELPKPVGIFAIRDALGRYLVQAALRKGLRVPEDVGVLGAGNDEAVCEAPPVPLSSLDLNWEKVGYRAAQRLEGILDGSMPPSGNTYLIPRLVARRSTALDVRDDEAVSRALDFIAQQCHRRLRVAEVARAAGVSARRLLRRFYAARRRTIAQEVTLARLARAKELLHTTGLPHAAIARGCGFSTARRMARMFQKHEHISPKAWRARAAVRPPSSVYPLDQAKVLLERTDYAIQLIAMLTGYGTIYRLEKAFLEQEQTTPAEYRRRYGRHPEGARRRPQPRPEPEERTYDVEIALDDAP
jgi:LacI family transcriptional regulator